MHYGITFGIKSHQGECEGDQMCSAAEILSACESHRVTRLETRRCRIIALVILSLETHGADIRTFRAAMKFATPRQMLEWTGAGRVRLSVGERAAAHIALARMAHLLNPKRRGQVRRCRIFQQQLHIQSG